MKIIAVDPGHRYHGIALWDVPSKTLQACGLPVVEGNSDRYATAAQLAVETLNWMKNVVKPGEDYRVVCESQVIYPGKSRKDVDLGDLLSVAASAGAVTALLAAVLEVKSLETVAPFEWKKAVRKDLMTQRIRDALFEVNPDATNYRTELKNHNVVDAVGIALYSARVMRAGGGLF